MERDYVQRSGCAIARGQQWAQFVMREVIFNEPWPPYEGKAANIARRKVADISADPRLAERLARLCHEAAGAWWARYRAES